MKAVSIFGVCAAVVFCTVADRALAGSIVPTIAATYEEVEVLLDGTVSLETVSAFPQAPGGPFEQLADPPRVVVQLPADIVLRLRKQGADVRTLRTILLVQPADIVPADGAGGVTAACSGTYRNGQSTVDVLIPDDNVWVYSAINITGAPAGSTVSCIDVHYEIFHTYIADLDVDLNDADQTYNYNLWGPNQGGGGQDLNQTVTGITTFNGEFANQEWDLWARDVASQDMGYIDYWWIKVYYGGTTAQPDLVVDSSSRTPATGVTPGGNVTLAHTIANRGTAAAATTFWATWFISTDASVTTSDGQWAYQELTGGLAAGATSSAGGALAWPNVAPYNTPGQTYYVAVMADDTNAITESNEANNWGQVWTVTLAGGGCCDPSLSAGDPVRLLVNNPGGATGLSTGHCGTVVCCDSDDPALPMFVSWDNWTSGNNQDSFCDAPPQAYPANSGWWVGCSDIVLDASCAPCPTPPVPSGPVPADNATNVPLDANLCWNVGAEIAKVIYGADDRKDVYQVSDAGLLSAADATVALVDTSILTNNGNGTYSLPGTPTFAQDTLARYGYSLCASEPFASQPVPAFCSGVLVGPNLVATAGHCIVNAADCAATAFVFGFDMTSLTTPVLTFPQADVYFCSAIIGRVQEAAGADWGIIRLDRPVTGHTALSVRCTGKVANARPLVMIGHPVGLPTKIAGGAIVRDNNPTTHFKANVDAYGGNSGSAVIDATGLQIEGLLVRGNPDFKLVGGCVASNVCPDTGCSGTTSLWEDVTRATEFAHLVPACTATQYDVYFGGCGSMSLVRAGGVETCWFPPALQANTEYCWQIVAKNSCGESPGSIWSFTTRTVCPAGPVTFVNPQSGTIDARQPYPPANAAQRQGINSVRVQGPAGINNLGCWGLCETRVDGTLNTITGIVDNGNGTFNVNLARTISIGAVTTLTYTDGGGIPSRGVFTSHPANVDADNASGPVDILVIIDILNLVRPAPWVNYSCDADQSGVCGPADILRVIDLLNGADQFDPWLGQALPACGVCCP